jgi:hypothetical protein
MKRGNDTYNMEYLSSVAEEDIPNLPKRIRCVIKKAIGDRFAVDSLDSGALQP